MTPEQHARAKEIFAAVNAMPADARAARVAELCAGDDAVQKEIERLLQFHDDRTLRDTIPIEADAGSTAAPVAGPVVVSVPPSSAAGSPSDEERRFVPGEMKADRYRIVDLLGRGGMGEVYRAEDLRLDLDVALKFLAPALAGRTAILRRFDQEVRLARQVTHPNVCRVYDLGEADGVPFISMEYVDGENLAILLKRINRLTCEKACDMARQLCSALAAAHAGNVLHRDLKPANVMLDGQGRVRVTDFGLAVFAHTVHGLEVRAGTPAYMSPEQISGLEVTTRSDIYALGLVLYEMFTGKPAFRGSSIAEYSRLHSTGTPVAPADLVEDLDPRIDRIILQCLAKDPAQRPESALQVAAALPGGNLFVAAMEAEQTLPPHLLAGAELPTSFGIRRAGSLLGVALVLLALFVGFGNNDRVTRIAAAQKAPEVLVERARELARELGFGDGLVYVARGFCEPTDLASALAGMAIHDGRAPPLAAGEQAVLFWCRLAREPLAPITAQAMAFNWGQVTLKDPPVSLIPGVTVLLNGAGQLRGLLAQPGMTASTALDPGPAWQSFISAAGFDVDAVQVATPDERYRFLADQRQAWTAVSAAGVNKRIEAASLLGGALFFAVLGAIDAEEAAWLAAEREEERRGLLANSVFPLLLFLMLLAALPLARRNLSNGRCDRVGAFRLALVVFVLQLLLWSLRASHVRYFLTEITMLAMAVFVALAYGMVVYVMYLAVEPFARRFWPQTIATWARVIRLRVWDPLVARHVLVGVIVGIFWALVVSHESDLIRWLELTPRPEILSGRLAEPLLGGQAAVALVLEVCIRGLGRAIVLAMLLVVLRILFRRPLVAAILATVMICPTVLPGSGHLVVGLFTMGVAVAGVAVWLLTEYGLVALVVAIVVSGLLRACPALRGLNAWYSDQALFFLALVLGTMIAAYVAARSKPSGPGALAMAD